MVFTFFKKFFFLFQYFYHDNELFLYSAKSQCFQEFKKQNETWVCAESKRLLTSDTTSRVTGQPLEPLRWRPITSLADGTGSHSPMGILEAGAQRHKWDPHPYPSHMWKDMRSGVIIKRRTIKRNEQLSKVMEHGGVLHVVYRGNSRGKSCCFQVSPGKMEKQFEMHPKTPQLR